MSITEDCPICSSSQRAKETFATAKVAEHIKEKAKHDEEHRAWVETYTDDGTLSEIRDALDQYSRSDME